MASTETEEAKSMKLYKDFRIIVFVIAMLIALIAIHPGYNSEEGFTSNLQYGIDLDGGTCLKLQLDGVIAGIDADPVQIIEKEFSDAFGSSRKSFLMRLGRSRSLTTRIPRSRSGRQNHLMRMQ
jgi:preprotein translocase subunit SecF